MLVLLKGLFSTLFVTPYICDGKWARVTYVSCLRLTHCFWRVF